MAELLVATGSGADSGVAGSGSAFSFSLYSVFFVFSSATSSSSSVFSLLSPFLSSSLSFSRSPPSSVLSLGFFLPLSSSPPSSLPLPCFYRQKQGGPTWWGGHCWPPLHYPSKVCKWLNCGRLIEPKPGKKFGEKWGRKSTSSPASRVQGKKKMVSFKTAPFWVLFFFLTVHETASFLPKRAVSFKWIWRQNVSDLK